MCQVTQSIRKKNIWLQLSYELYSAIQIKYIQENKNF